MKKKITYIIILTFLIISCSKEDLTVNNNIIVLGHGGMGIGQTYPMNSYESILKCLNIGTDGTEIDVQMTKDSVLVAYHSSDLSDETNLSGRINYFNWKEIENAFYVSTPYLNYSIISLDSLFANVRNLEDYKFTFDCKFYTSSNAINFQKAYINSLAKIINKYDLKSQCLYRIS
jgi:glycerophosphoryl diester phosphodiesterase